MLEERAWVVAGSGATMWTRSGRSFQSCRNASLSMPQIDHPGCPAQKRPALYQFK